MRIRRNETVSILSGRDKGKQGKVQKVYTKKGLFLVEGLNIVKRHQKPTGTVRQAGIIEQEAPVKVSNVALVCPKCNKPTRVRYGFLEDKTKIRVCKLCQENLE